MAHCRPNALSRYIWGARAMYVDWAWGEAVSSGVDGEVCYCRTGCEIQLNVTLDPERCRAVCMIGANVGRPAPRSTLTESLPSFATTTSGMVSPSTSPVLTATGVSPAAYATGRPNVRRRCLARRRLCHRSD